MKANTQTLHHIFRVACAMCFIGHGAFGILTKRIWCDYFGVFGIGEAMAYDLMPVVGIVDIALGFVLLFYPLRISAVWLVFWGFFTASLRPLAGESFAELLERAGNFGAPIALLMLSVSSLISRDSMFHKLVPDDNLGAQEWKTIRLTLQIVGFMLLFGHGWLNVIEKEGLIEQYTRFGFSAPEQTALFIGIFEIAGACSLLLWPSRSIVLLLLLWKILSETYYPAYALLEWVERGGSYAVLLGLWLLIGRKTASDLRPLEARTSRGVEVHVLEKS